MGAEGSQVEEALHMHAVELPLAAPAGSCSSALLPCVSLERRNILVSWETAI